MHAQIITIFPEMFPGTLGDALAGKALAEGIWSFATINPRDFATDNHKTVDDTPFGGGAGMVMKPDILHAAVASLPQAGRKIYLSPRGKLLTQELAAELAREPTLTLLCGRYEGVDQRVLDHDGFEEISIGDYILSGGELAAQVLLDTVIRLLPGVLGNAETHTEESFSGGLLEYPHYTRPAVWEGQAVPEVLTSGHHAKIKSWRFEQQMAITAARRPDLLDRRDNNTAVPDHSSGRSRKGETG